jgi:hypothetical protein
MEKKIKEGLQERGIQKVRFEDNEFEANHEKLLEIMDGAIGAGLKKQVKVAKKTAKKVSAWNDESESD